MALKFNNSKIRIWKGVGKKDKCTTIGIRFNKDNDSREIYRVYSTIKSIFELKYGKGKK